MHAWRVPPISRISSASLRGLCCCLPNNSQFQCIFPGSPKLWWRSEGWSQKVDSFTDIFVLVVCCAYLNTVDARMCPKQIRMAVNLAGALTFCWFLPQQKEQCKDWAEECHRRLLDDFFQQFSTVFNRRLCVLQYLFSSNTAHVWLAADRYSYVRTYLCSKQSLVKLAGWSFQRSYPILSYKYIYIYSICIFR